LIYGGIRGVRFTTGDPKTAVVTPDMIEPLAARIAAYGWHVQLNMPIEHIVGYAGVLDRIPTQIVFDHMGKVPSLDHPSYKTIRNLIDKRKAWVKISGAYINSEVGPPDYPVSGVGSARASVRRGCAGALRVGQRLAASRAEGEARRCRAVRSVRDLGAGGGHAQAHAGR
jgi:predicted TIM-barrel fold metal-dependent hydrolase